MKICVFVLKKVIFYIIKNQSDIDCDLLDKS